MHKMRSLGTWLIFGMMALFLLGGLGACAGGSHTPTHIPPCEAMRPYLHYQGRYYYETAGALLPSSDRGAPVTTIGDGPSQAASCLGAGATVYSVQGRTVTTDLALESGDGLQLFEVPALTPTPTPTAVLGGASGQEVINTAGTPVKQN